MSVNVKINIDTSFDTDKSIVSEENFSKLMKNYENIKNSLDQKFRNQTGWFNKTNIEIISNRKKQQGQNFEKKFFYESDASVDPEKKKEVLSYRYKILSSLADSIGSKIESDKKGFALFDSNLDTRTDNNQIKNYFKHLNSLMSQELNEIIVRGRCKYEDLAQSDVNKPKKPTNNHYSSDDDDINNMTPEEKKEHYQSIKEESKSTWDSKIAELDARFENVENDEEIDLTEFSEKRGVLSFFKYQYEYDKDEYDENNPGFARKIATAFHNFKLFEKDDESEGNDQSSDFFLKKVFIKNFSKETMTKMKRLGIYGSLNAKYKEVEESFEYLLKSSDDIEATGERLEKVKNFVGDSKLSNSQQTAVTNLENFYLFKQINHLSIFSANLLDYIDDINSTSSEKRKAAKKLINLLNSAAIGAKNLSDSIKEELNDNLEGNKKPDDDTDTDKNVEEVKITSPLKNPVLTYNKAKAKAVFLATIAAVIDQKVNSKYKVDLSDEENQYNIISHSSKSMVKLNNSLKASEIKNIETEYKNKLNQYNDTSLEIEALTKKLEELNKIPATSTPAPTAPNAPVPVPAPTVNANQAEITKLNSDVENKNKDLAKFETELKTIINKISDPITKFENSISSYNNRLIKYINEDIFTNADDARFIKKDIEEFNKAIENPYIVDGNNYKLQTKYNFLKPFLELDLNDKLGTELFKSNISLSFVYSESVRLKMIPGHLAQNWGYEQSNSKRKIVNLYINFINLQMAYFLCIAKDAVIYNASKTHLSDDEKKNNSVINDIFKGPSNFKNLNLIEELRKIQEKFISSNGNTAAVLEFDNNISELLQKISAQFTISKGYEIDLTNQGAAINSEIIDIKTNLPNKDDFSKPDAIKVYLENKCNTIDNIKAKYPDYFKKDSKVYEILTNNIDVVEADKQLKAISSS